VVTHRAGVLLLAVGRGEPHRERRVVEHAQHVCAIVAAQIDVAGSDIHAGHDVEALASVIAANYEGAARS
jgi:hypothetical protein